MPRLPLGVILDFDGVITRTAKRDEVLRRCESEMGLPAGRLMKVLFSGPHWWDLSMGRASEEQYWSVVCQQLHGRVPAILEPFRRSFFAYEELNQATIAWARVLRRRHTLALLSNATLYLDTYLEETGLRSLFHVVVNSARVGLRKPDVRIYELTLLRMELDAAQCVLIDDKERNTAAAQSVGLPSIVFRSVRDARRRMAEMACLDRG